MKRISLIITILFITASTFYQGSKLYGWSGMYIAPKISYFPQEVSRSVWRHYAGGGIAAGFDFFRLTDPYPLPFRLELEYIGRLLATNTAFTFHSVMAGVYYDLNLFYVRAHELDTLTTKGVYTTKRPFMTLYLSMHLGAQIAYQITERGGSAFIQTNTGISRTSILFAIGAGFAVHITSWFALDLGYRVVLGPGFRYGNEVLLSFRFTRP